MSFYLSALLPQSADSSDAELAPSLTDSPDESSSSSSETSMSPPTHSSSPLQQRAPPPLRPRPPSALGSSAPKFARPLPLSRLNSPQSSSTGSLPSLPASSPVSSPAVPARPRPLPASPTASPPSLPTASPPSLPSVPPPSLPSVPPPSLPTPSLLSTSTPPTPLSASMSSPALLSASSPLSSSPSPQASPPISTSARSRSASKSTFTLFRKNSTADESPSSSAAAALDSPPSSLSSPLADQHDDFLPPGIGNQSPSPSASSPLTSAAALLPDVQLTGSDQSTALSSSSSSSSSSDIESEQRDGQTVITALTIPALFGELEKSRVSSEMHRLLVATHSYFLPSEQLFGEICERLLSGAPAAATFAERQLFIARLGSLLKLWGLWNVAAMQQDSSLKELLDRTLNRLLADGDEQLKNYVRSQIQLPIDKAVQNLAAENERVALSPFADVPTSWERSDDDVAVDTGLLLDNSPDELSRNLTFLESLYFSRISVAELMNKRFEKPDRSPNLYATIERFNVVTSWVSTLVVMAPSVSRRVDAIARFIDLAKAFEQAKNYSGVIQIVSALQNVSISRLKQTWALVPPRSMKLFEELCPYANPEGNYAFYRKQLQNATPPFLPYLGCFTKDLTAIEEMTTTLPSGKLNWEKMTHLGRILETVEKTKEQPYKIQPNIALAKRLLSLPLMSEKAIYRVSKQIEAGANAQGGGSTSEKITRKTIEREKKLQAKEERQKQKEERAKKAQQKTKPPRSERQAICSRCAQLRASFETARTLQKQLDTERSEVLTRQGFLDRRVDEFADFLSQAQAGTAATPPGDLIKETKAELLKHYFEISQLDAAVTANAKRIAEGHAERAHDNTAVDQLTAHLASYAAAAKKLQASLALLRAAAHHHQQPPELSGLFDFVRDAFAAMTANLMRQIAADYPAIKPVEQQPHAPMIRRTSFRT